LTLDVNTMEYRPRQKAKFGSLEMSKAVEETRERLRALVGPLLDGQTGDKAQQFMWGGLSEMCLYAARRVPEISDNVADVDRAMRWGFGWELGPFEMLDAVGVKAFAAQVQKEGRAIPPVIEKVLSSGSKGFYESEKGTRTVFDICTGGARKVEEPKGVRSDVDRAMRWGFGWELGPFEMLDAVGVKAFAAQVQKEGRAIPPVIEKVLSSGSKGFYESEKGTRTVFDICTGGARKVEEPKGV